VVLLVMFLIPEKKREETVEGALPVPVPGGFPVPPMPAGGAVRGSAAPLTFRDELSHEEI
jgi:NADH-quinone oxidoreductase subunit H